MLKPEELTNPASCLNKARESEMLFVLLGRVVAAPYAIRKWAHQRVFLGKNTLDDPQIKEALDCANAMEEAQSNGNWMQDAS